MRSYKLKGGGILQGNSAGELVGTLRAMSFNPCENEDIYMYETANACYMQEGAIISIKSVEEFIHDLIENKFMEEIDD
jgi:hypothetical protein